MIRRRLAEVKNYGNCSEPTSKMLRISSVWRIRQIKFHKTGLKMQAFSACFMKFCLALNSYKS